MLEGSELGVVYLHEAVHYVSNSSGGGLKLHQNGGQVRRRGKTEGTSGGGGVD